jgi:hypothetical protein
MRTEKGPGSPTSNSDPLVIYGLREIERNTLEKLSLPGGNNLVGKRRGYLKSSTATSAGYAALAGVVKENETSVSVAHHRSG